MATDWKTFPLEFKGGLISNLSPLQQGTNAVGSATVLENFEPSLSGGYSKILGFRKHNSSAVPVKDANGNVIGSPSLSQKLIQLVACVSNNYSVLVARNDKFYVVSTSSIDQAHSDAATNISQRSALTGGKIRFAHYNFGAGEKTILVDGVNSVAYYDGSQSVGSRVTFSDKTNAAFSGTIGAKFATEFKNHIVLAKTNTIIIGSIGVDNDFNSAGAGCIEINVKDQITGLKVFREQLIVFTRNTVQKVVGTSVADFKLSTITDDIGCVHEDTIQEIGGDILFFAPDGIRSLASTENIGDFGLDVASKPIKKNVEDLSGATFDSYVIRPKGQYRLFAFTQALSVDISEGLLATKFIDQGGAGYNWATLKGIKSYVSDSRHYGTASNVAQLPELVAFANDDGYVYQGEITNAFDTVPIRGIYESPYMPFDDPTIRKTMYKCGLYLDPKGSVTAQLNIKFDQDESGVVQPQPISIVTTGNVLSFYNDVDSTYDTSVYSLPFNKLYNNNVIGSGKTVAIRIEENSTNASFRLDTAVLEYGVETRQ